MAWKQAHLITSHSTHVYISVWLCSLFNLQTYSWINMCSCNDVKLLPRRWSWRQRASIWYTEVHPLPWLKSLVSRENTPYWAPEPCLYSTLKNRGSEKKKHPAGHTVLPGLCQKKKEEGQNHFLFSVSQESVEEDCKKSLPANLACGKTELTQFSSL